VTVGDLSNRWRGQRWRELVALQLQASGIETAHVRPLPRKISEELAEEGARPDIEGVPGWHLDAAADIQSRLSVRLDAAEQSARFAGTSRAAVALYRQGRPASEAYVVMSLGTFAQLVAQAEGEAWPWASESAHHRSPGRSRSRWGASATRSRPAPESRTRRASDWPTS
jgi:hypothetical protein